MNTHADNAPKEKDPSSLENRSQNLINPKKKTQFTDNRPEAVAQRKFQEKANNSPQAMQLSALQGSMGHGSNQPIQLVLTENGEKNKQAVKWIRKLIPEIESRLEDIDGMADYRKSYITAPERVRINAIGATIASYLLETNNAHFSSDNQYNEGGVSRLEFLENRLVQYKLEVGRLVQKYVLRDNNDFLRIVVSAMPTFRNRVLANSDLAARVFNFGGLQYAKDQIADYITQEITEFKKPGLKAWMAGLDSEPSDSDIIIINAGNISGIKVHLTNHKNNVQAAASLDLSNAAIRNILFPAAAGGVSWRGAHTTLELFGKRDKRNPHYFVGAGLKMPSNEVDASGISPNAACRAKLSDEGISMPALRTGLSNRLTNALANTVMPEIVNVRAAREAQIL